MSDDLQAFLADKWKLARPEATPPLYQLLSDAALAVVHLETERERAAFLGHFAGELVGLGVDAGLSLGELRRLAARLQNELAEAITREVER